jgi:hypothetical protein
MNPIIELIEHLSHWIRPYLWHLCMALAATLLAIYGGKINKWVRSMITGYHFLVRLSIFVLVCVFGYGMLTLLLTRVIAAMLVQASLTWLFPIVLLTFIFVGYLAERQRQI